MSSPVRSSTATVEHKDAPANAGASLIAPEGRGKDNTFGKEREVYKRGVISLDYPTQNLTRPAGINQPCRLASLHDAEKVRTLIRENIEGLKTVLRWNAGHRDNVPSSTSPARTPKKQAGAHAYSVDVADWKTLVDALGGREDDVMGEARGKEYALVPLGVSV